MNCTPVRRARRVLALAPCAGPVEPPRQGPRGFEHLCHRTVYSGIRRRAEGIRRPLLAQENPRPPASARPALDPQREPGLHEALVRGGGMVRPGPSPWNRRAQAQAEALLAHPYRAGPLASQQPRAVHHLRCPVGVPQRTASKDPSAKCLTSSSRSGNCPFAILPLAFSSENHAARSTSGNSCRRPE